MQASTIDSIHRMNVPLNEIIPLHPLYSSVQSRETNHAQERGNNKHFVWLKLVLLVSPTSNKKRKKRFTKHIRQKYSK